jgi:hypothetical protein
MKDDKFAVILPFQFGTPLIIRADIFFARH